ncbi:MAG: LysR family transcriptional regulator [Pseudomonadota bacterium]
MNVRQLRYFIAIVERGSVSSAARTLNVAQPALSQHILNLEADLATELLVRSSKGVKPTKAGEVLYQHARKIVAQLKQAIDDVRSEADTPRGEVLIVVPPMLGVHIAPRLLERIADGFPDIELRIQEELGLDVCEMVQSGRADLGISARQNLGPKLEFVHIYTEPLYLASRRRPHDPPCSGEETVSCDDLFEVPLVLSQKSHAVRELVEAVANETGRGLNIRVTTESTRLRISYIQSGVTHGVLPWPSLDTPWRRGELRARRIDDARLTRDICFVWPKNQPMSAATKCVLNETLAICQQLFEEGIVKGDIVADLAQFQNP